MQTLYIILGWLLGLLGNPIVSRIEKRYKRNDLKKVIFSELKNLKLRLVANFWKIQMHLGEFDKLTLQWINNVYEKLAALSHMLRGCLVQIAAGCGKITS